jgi:hypothetical protein
MSFSKKKGGSGDPHHRNFGTDLTGIGESPRLSCIALDSNIFCSPPRRKMATNEVTAQIFYYIRVSSSLITNCSSTVQYTNLERLLRVENGSTQSASLFDLACAGEPPGPCGGNMQRGHVPRCQRQGRGDSALESIFTVHGRLCTRLDPAATLPLSRGPPAAGRQHRGGHPGL